MRDESRIDGRNPAHDPAGLTSLHLRRAREGDGDSLAWIIEKFSPLLLANARYRLGGSLRSLYDPEDLVNDVWTVALPRLKELPDRGGRYTPVLLKFLSTTLLNRFYNLVHKHVRGKPRRLRGEMDSEGEPLDRLPDPLTGIVTRLARQETASAVAEKFEKLAPKDRELIILRGIEQHSYKEIAAIPRSCERSFPVRSSRSFSRNNSRAGTNKALGS